MKKRIIWATVSFMVVIALMVASCGGEVTDEDEEEITNGEEEVDNGEEEEEEEEEVIDDGKNMVVNAAGKLVERPQYGGWYYTSMTSDLRGFDDTLGTSPHYAVAPLNIVYDKLITGDWAKGSQGTEEASWTIGATLFPHLETGSIAESYEIPDNETIIFHIRRGIHFQDKPPANGRELNAHDAALCLSRTFYNKGAFLGLLYPVAAGKGPTSITATDDWTVVMKVPPVWQSAIFIAAADWTFIFPKDAIEEYGDMSDWENACGTGPFQLTDYVPVSSLTFTKNANYWRHNPLHPEDQLPYVDGAKIMVIPDRTTAQAAFRTGKLEAMTGLNKDDWESLLRTTPELLWAKLAPGGNSVIFMRTDKPELPYTDIRVRRALAMAIDNQAIIDDYYEGEAEMINIPISNIPEYAQMFTPLEELPEDVQELYGYYPEEAKELITDAGYPDGFTCSVLSNSEGLLPIIKDMWDKVDVTMNIEIRDPTVVTSMVQRMQHEDMFYTAIGANPLVLPYWDPTGNLNFSAVNDAHFNELYEQIGLNFFDWDKCCELLKEITPYILSKAYFINLPGSYSYFAWWPWLKGWHGEITVGYYSYYNQLTYLWIDTGLREELTGISR